MPVTAHAAVAAVAVTAASRFGCVDRARECLVAAVARLSVRSSDIDVKSLRVKLSCGARSRASSAV